MDTLSALTVADDSPVVDRVAEKVRTVAAVKPALVRLIAVLLGAAAFASACGKNPVSSSSSTPGGGSTAGSTSPTLPTIAAADLTFCIDETNRYRAMRSRPALARSTSIEQFAADGAKSDALANVPHQHVSTTPFPGGGAWGENEVLRWPYNLAPTVQGIVAQAILSFYSEGPGGGHYENIVGPYTQIGCGMYVDANGITIIEDFR